ncbi:hypothetical protein TW83_00300 [Paracoccus sp. S4493]|uniref:hypothetical protein n=1 Tax=Paracoccus sp. S4493 TaxID=579490 RepID=UPI0005FA39E5|nr:hypothetical protein [Paracoccus sp. S4493]KJZ33015.1 hypothetical protein TW83_00300 [Paracoccus sp. S4493]
MALTLTRAVNAVISDNTRVDKGPMRDLINDLIRAIDGNNTRSARVYTSRADAVTQIGAGRLDPLVSAVVTIEGAVLVIRARTVFADDPLFPEAAGDRWGAVLRIDTSARIWPTTTTDFAPLRPPAGTDQISVGTNSGVQTWRRINAPATVDPAIHQRDANGTWWMLAENTSAIRTLIANVAGSIATAAFPQASNIAGTANAITGLLPYGNGTAALAGQRISFIPLAANTGAATFNAIQIRTENDQQITAGAIVAGRRVFLERDPAVNVWRMMAGGITQADVAATLATTLAPILARLQAVETAATGAIETVTGETERALATDAAGNAIMVWRPGEDGGIDAHMARTFWERGAPYIGGGGTGGLLSTTALHAVSGHGQSLLVGGEYENSGVSRADLISRARQGAALMLEGMQRGDTDRVVPITTVDMPRSQGYNEAVPPTGIGAAVPGATTSTAVWPMAVAMNEYRHDHDLRMVPVVTQCHGISGIMIEAILDKAGVAWNNMRFWYESMVARAAAETKSLFVPWHQWVHGPSAKSYAPNRYLNLLWQYNDDFHNLLKAVGARGPGTLLIQQTGGNANTSNVAGDPWHVTDEQLQFCEAGGGVLTTPDYAYPIFDNNVHQDAFGTVQAGEVTARAAVETEAGKRWTINRPRPRLMGSTLILEYETLRPGEYLDRHDPSRYGGQGIDDYLGFQVEGATITEIQVRGRQVALTCSAPPTGVRYAMQAQDASIFANNRWSAFRGLLRTSDVWPSKLLPGQQLYRWTPSFKMMF